MFWKIILRINWVYLKEIHQISHMWICTLLHRPRWKCPFISGVSHLYKRMTRGCWSTCFSSWDHGSWVVEEETGRLSHHRLFPPSVWKDADGPAHGHDRRRRLSVPCLGQKALPVEQVCFPPPNWFQVGWRLSMEHTLLLYLHCTVHEWISSRGLDWFLSQLDPAQVHILAA